VTVKAPRLYLITDRKATNGRPLLDVLAEALSGARGSPHQLAVQLREKDLSGRELYELARAVRPITSAAGAWLFVNDRIDVALAAGADGVHLAGGSLSPGDARALGPLRVAASTHTPDDVARAAAAGVDFVVFGPVFATASKPAVAPVGLATLKIVTGLGIPVLALGGVSADNVADCVINGAVGVAGIRFVISATNSAARVSSLLACLAPSET
jgi:thiamine-phosphate pyrophosphorylase